MEEIDNYPSQINSTDACESMITSKSFMNKKRKFHDISDFPLPKHMCTVRSDSSSEQNPENGSSKKWMSQIESWESGKYNSFSSEDGNSTMSVSCDLPSTSSVNWSDCSSDTSFFTLNSTSETKSIESGGQLQYIRYEDQLLEYGKYVDCDSSEYEYDGIVCKDKELEDLLHSNGGNEENFILASGIWNVIQETQQETKNLTNDKEFEQYFSMLML